MSTATSKIITSCPHCGAKFRVNHSSLGRMEMCSKCNAPFEVSKHEQAVQPSPANPPANPGASPTHVIHSDHKAKTMNMLGSLAGATGTIVIALVFFLLAAWCLIDSVTAYSAANSVMHQNYAVLCMLGFIASSFVGFFVIVAYAIGSKLDRLASGSIHGVSSITVAKSN